MDEPGLRDTGERMVPEFHSGTLLYAEHAIRYQAVLSLLTGKDVLDVACGVGYGTQVMGAFAGSAVGIDNDAAAVAYAQAHHAAPNVTYIVADAQQMPLQDASVDVVVCFETIEHIVDQHAFLDEVQRVLRPIGLLIVSTPNARQSGGDNPFHVHELHVHELQAMLASGFDAVDTYVQGSWFATAVLPAQPAGSSQPPAVELFDAVPVSTADAMYVVCVAARGQLAPPLTSLVALAEPWGSGVRRLSQPLAAHSDEQQRVMDHLTREVSRLEAEKLGAGEEALRLAVERQRLEEAYRSRTAELECFQASAGGRLNDIVRTVTQWRRRARRRGP